MTTTKEGIQKRVSDLARGIWLGNHRPPGRDLWCWLQAEAHVWYDLGHDDGLYRGRRWALLDLGLDLDLPCEGLGSIDRRTWVEPPSANARDAFLRGWKSGGKKGYEHAWQCFKHNEGWWHWLWRNWTGNYTGPPQ
jgi:hypothetical protein